MEKLRIGLDCDEVVCDFMGAYINRYGLEESHKITCRCQRELRHDRDFWEGLNLLRKPDFQVTLWCTKRVNPKLYTKNWLKTHGLPDKPVYQVINPTANKAHYIKGKVDVFIDDSVSNFIAMNKSGVPCLLMDHWYNKSFDTPYRVYSLNYDEIVNVYNKLRAEQN